MSLFLAFNWNQCCNLSCFKDFECKLKRGGMQSGHVEKRWPMLADYRKVFRIKGSQLSMNPKKSEQFELKVTLSPHWNMVPSDLRHLWVWQDNRECISWWCSTTHLSHACLGFPGLNGTQEGAKSLRKQA